MPDEDGRAYAGWGSRLGAYLIDMLILFVPILILLVIVVASASDEDSGGGTALTYLATLVVPAIYFVVMHGGERGQTFGKRAVGIRVVDERGGSIGYGRAFGRYAITFVFGIFILPVLLDYLWPLWDRKNQSLHDKVVGSFVVRA